MVSPATTSGRSISNVGRARYWSRCARPACRVRYGSNHLNGAQKLTEDWQQRAALLTATFEKQPVGYVSIRTNIVPDTAWIDDLTVLRRMRRQGIGTALILSAQNWANQHTYRRMIVEMQSKNYPAICLVQKLGYDFSGYHERYFGNLDIALFFSKILA